MIIQTSVAARNACGDVPATIDVPIIGREAEGGRQARPCTVVSSWSWNVGVGGCVEAVGEVNGTDAW